MLEPRLGLSLLAALTMAACTSPDLGEAKDHGEATIHLSGYGVNTSKDASGQANKAGTPSEASNALAGGQAEASQAPPLRGWGGGGGSISFTDTLVGSGATAKKGDEIRVHYTGKLLDGTVFDSSVTRNRPFDFPLGAGRVIQGWDEGVVGMKVGGKRTLTVPPDKGYGNRPAGKIPPGSTLVFDIELLEIIPPLPAAQGPEAFKPVVNTFRTPGKVKVSVHKEGTGNEAQANDIVEVHYTGTIKADGSEFDSSVSRGKPIKFPVGTGRVIKGWDEAIVGMKVGELRTIEIPPDMGYGDRARPKIPAGSTLVFQVELMRITPGAPPPKPAAQPAG